MIPPSRVQFEEDFNEPLEQRTLKERQTSTERSTEPRKDARDPETT